MPGAGELPEEFTGPVAYADRWLWIAIALVVAVVVFYVLTWWLTRAPRPPAPRPVVRDVASTRARHLAEIDEVVTAVAAGRLTPREGHQRLSSTVRSYVEEVSGLPARSMALADFRAQAPGSLQDLVGAIELMYPPEFSPEGSAESDGAVASATVDAAAQRARAVVAGWGG